MKTTNIRMTRSTDLTSFWVIAKDSKSGKELVHTKSFTFAEARELLVQSKGKLLRKPKWVEYVKPVPAPKKPYVKRAPTQMSQQEADQYANCM